MKEAMCKVDEASGLQFSDATHPDQEVLFTPEPDSADLKRRIVSEFEGREVPVSEIEDYVVAATPHCEWTAPGIPETTAFFGRVILS
jgi:hypothetical protein